MFSAAVARRLAWRDLDASRRQSALIVTLVALPVLVATVFSILFVSALPTTAQQVEAMMGRYPAVVQPMPASDGVCTQTGLGDRGCLRESEPDNPITPTPLAKLSTGAVALERTALAEVAVGDFQIPTFIMAVDLPNPRLDGRWKVDGTRPGPGEVWATRDFLTAMGAAVGDAVTVAGHSYRITGIVTLRRGSMDWATASPGLVVLPGHPLDTGEATRAYLDRIPELGAVEGWNRAGWSALSAEALSMNWAQTKEGDAVGLWIAAGQLVLFLVVGSIVGAAFTANLQRRQRTLALLRATGATSRTVRATVLWQGAILGGLGALTGVTLGLGVGIVSARIAADREVLGVFTVNINWTHPVIFAASAVLVTLLAVRWAARGVLRADPLATLRSSRAASGRMRRPWVALILLVAGISFAVWAGAVADLDNAKAMERSMVLAITSGVALWLAALIGTGWLLQQLAKLRSPSLAWRLALRDATRHRSRTLATTAATASGTTLALLPLLVMGLADAVAIQSYQPPTGPRLMYAPMWGMGKPGEAKAAQNLADQVMAAPSEAVLVDVARIDGDESWAFRAPCGADCRFAVTDVLVAGPEYLRLVLQRTDAAAEQALADGEVVIFDDRQQRADGAVELVHGPPEEAQVKTIMQVYLAGPVPWLMGAISPETAQRLGIPHQPTNLFLRYPTQPTSSQVERLNTMLRRAQIDAYFYADIGPQRPGSGWLTPTALIGIAVGLAVAVVGAGLAIRDGEADRTLLANLGARDRTQRRVGGAQALFCVGLGALTGALTVFVPVVAVSAGLGGQAQFLPWLHMAAVVLVPVPMVALISHLLTRPIVARVVRQE